MDTSRVLAGGGGGGGGFLPPFWNPNWRGDYGSSSSSSTPGTSLTTPSSYYSSTSGGSSSPHGIHSPLPLDLSCRDAQDLGKKLISNCSFEELFSVADGGDPYTTSFVQFAGRWTRALTEIAGSTRTTLLTAHDDMLISVPEEQQEPRPVHFHVQPARFAQTSIIKMLPFVDDIVAAAAAGVGFAPAAAPTEKLRPLIAVREALYTASQDIRLSSCFTPSAEAKSITDEVACLLSSEQGKLDDAIWNAMEDTRTRLLKASTEQDDDSSWWGSQTPPQGSPSPAIHKVTRAIVSYINLLASTNNDAAVAYQVAGQAALLHRYEPSISSVSPLGSLIMETASCLEEKLAEISWSWFPEQSLRFLFLINNSYFICQELSPAPEVLESHVAALARKVDTYIKTYVQVSWAPVLSCLFIARPLCLGRYCSPAMFESEFQKTYSAQKLWKVPDPKLRRRLRVAVVEKVVSGFTKYLEYNHVSPSRITPQDLMDMLQELFEG